MRKSSKIVRSRLVVAASLVMHIAAMSRAKPVETSVDAKRNSLHAALA